MGKNFPAVEGVPAVDLLGSIAKNPKSLIDIEEVHHHLATVVVFIRERMNPIACATAEQATQFEGDLLAYAQKVSGHTPDLASIYADHIENLTPVDFVNMTLQFQQACGNCLTENCNRRDPDFPVELVKDKELNRKKREEVTESSK